MCVSKCVCVCVRRTLPGLIPADQSDKPVDELRARQGPTPIDVLFSKLFLSARRSRSRPRCDSTVAQRCCSKSVQKSRRRLLAHSVLQLTRTCCHEERRSAEDVMSWKRGCQCGLSAFVKENNDVCVCVCAGGCSDGFTCPF